MDKATVSHVIVGPTSTHSVLLLVQDDVLGSTKGLAEILVQPHDVSSFNPFSSFPYQDYH